MKRKLTRIALLAAAICAAAATGAWASAKYLFLYIGDGMGANQRLLAEFYLAAKNGQKDASRVVPLRMDRFPVLGMMRIPAHDKLITDSAAAATAMGTGTKTDDSAIAVLPDRKTPLRTIAEEAHAAGLAVGIVSSAPINHATPACFYAHCRSRDGYAIAKCLPGSGFEYFAGAPLTRPKGRGKDQPDIHEAIRRGGYTIADGFDAGARVPQGKKLVVIGPLAASNGGFPYAIDSRVNSLMQAVSLGIHRLEGSGRGFFMMVEGGKIDWAAHINDTRTVIDEVLNMDEALQPALDFASRHPAETLILVTSDHDTGGMALGWYGSKYELHPEVLAAQKGSGESFYLQLAPLRNRHAEAGEAIAAASAFYGFGTVSADERAALSEAWRLARTDYEKRRLIPGYTVQYGSFDPFVIQCQRVLDHRAGVGWTNWAHTAAPIPVSAFGSGAELFGGWFDNTELYSRMKKAMALR